MSIEQSVLLILAVAMIAQSVINVVQQFYIQKSLPIDEVRKILADAKPIADATKTTIDNELINAGEKILDKLEEAQA